MIGRRAEARNWRRAERANLAEVERAPCLAQEQVGAEWKQRSDWKRQASGGGSHSHWGAPAPGVHPIFFLSISQVQVHRRVGPASPICIPPVQVSARHQPFVPREISIGCLRSPAHPAHDHGVRRQSTDRWIYIRPYVSGLVVRYTYNIGPSCFSVSYIWSIFLLYCWN